VVGDDAEGDGQLIVSLIAGEKKKKSDFYVFKRLFLFDLNRTCSSSTFFFLLGGIMKPYFYLLYPGLH